MRSIKTILATVLLGVFLTIGCDSVVDQNSTDTSEFQVQSTENYFSVGSFGLLDSFTQDELDNNWVADRQFPSGGVESVSAYDRDDVAAISVIGEDQSTQGQFYYFEGIKKVDDFGPAVRVDLYVPAEWANPATSPANVGFWASDDPITSYPIIVYRNSETVEAGFYTWTYDWDAGAWVYVLSDVEVNYNGWNTLSIILSDTENVAEYFINGTKTGSVYNAGDNIGQVFLNHYNDGVLDYTTYWHAGDPKDVCKNGGWEDLGFKNQGQCIRFVNTGKDSR
jgi:hypothetical protein